MVMTNAELATQLRRLNRLNRDELAAVNDRNAHRAPNAAHLASAIAKLNDPCDAKYPKRAKRWTR